MPPSRGIERRRRSCSTGPDSTGTGSSFSGDATAPRPWTSRPMRFVPSKRAAFWLWTCRVNTFSTSAVRLVAVAAGPLRPIRGRP